MLVGFPVGGYAADLVVDGVDSLGAAVIGGLITGTILGVVQWFALRQLLSPSWILATALGTAGGLTAGAALVHYGIGRVDLALMGAVTGAAVGTLQALVLTRRRIRGAGWWAAANAPAWALGWYTSSFVIARNIGERFSVFGASGAFVFGVLTWVLLAALLRRTASAPRGAAAPR